MLHEKKTLSTAQLFRDFISRFEAYDNECSEDMDKLGETIFHQDLVISKSSGEGLTKHEFLNVLKLLRKSRAGIQIQTLKAAFLDSFDFTLIFDLAESAVTKRSFCMRTTMILRDGQIWSMFLNDTGSPYIFNLFLVQTSVSALLKESGIETK